MTDEIQGASVSDLSLSSRYLLEPSPQLFRELSDQVMRSGNYSPSVNPLTIGSALQEEDGAARVLPALETLLPGASLNPGIHMLLSEAHRQLGHPDDAAREAAWYQATLSGILNTGDGSIDRPWRVLMISDEYDVLRALGQTPARQELLSTGDVPCDKLVCEGGTEYYFELAWMC